MSVQKIYFVLLAATLGGCASVSNLIKERHDAREQAYINSAQESCKKYGFHENTDAFSQCIQNDVNAAKARDSNDANARLNSSSSPSSTKTSCTNTIGGMECATH